MVQEREWQHGLAHPLHAVRDAGFDLAQTRDQGSHSLDLLQPFSLRILVIGHELEHYFPKSAFFRTAIP